MCVARRSPASLPHAPDAISPPTPNPGHENDRRRHRPGEPAGGRDLGELRRQGVGATQPLDRRRPRLVRGHPVSGQPGQLVPEVPLQLVDHVGASGERRGEAPPPALDLPLDVFHVSPPQSCPSICTATRHCSFWSDRASRPAGLKA